MFNFANVIINIINIINLIIDEALCVGNKRIGTYKAA